MSKKFQMIWTIFIIYVVGYFAICLITGVQGFLWLELTLLSLIVSVVTLKKEHFPRGKGLILPTVFALLYLISNIYIFNLFTVIKAVILFLSACAAVSVFKNYGENSLKWIKNDKKQDIFLSIAIGILFGIIWGTINYFLMKGSNPIDNADPLKALIFALNPAVSEEIADRCIFFAFCLSMADGKLKKGFQTFTAWCMMIVPHILPHMLFDLSAGVIGSLVQWTISLALYIAVFGFIFAFLQKKRDVTSAMIAHGTVDFIRFCIFGLPI